MFIMLLSFFLILNAVSNFESIKAQPVLNSVSLAFSSKKAEEPLKPNIVESKVKSVNEGDTLDKLRALFNANITGLEAKKNRLGTVMHVRMDVKAFDRAISAPVRATRNAPLDQISGAFIPTLVSLLQTRESEIPYRMDMVLATPQTAAEAVSNDTQALKANMQKMAQFSMKLERSGIQKKLMSIGIARGKPGTIDIYFRRYEPFNPTGLEPNLEQGEGL